MSLNREVVKVEKKVWKIPHNGLVLVIHPAMFQKGQDHDGPTDGSGAGPHHLPHAEDHHQRLRELSGGHTLQG